MTSLLDGTGFVGMNAIYKENLKNYFNFLDTELEENNLKIHPEQIYNMDETGIPLILDHLKLLLFRVRRKFNINAWDQSIRLFLDAVEQAK